MSNKNLLLTLQADIEAKLAPLEAILKGAERGNMGLTLDSAKTPEWRAAKALYAVYWKQYQAVNRNLSKIRKAIGYEVVNGKRVVIYKYKGE